MRLRSIRDQFSSRTTVIAVVLVSLLATAALWRAARATVEDSTLRHLDGEVRHFLIAARAQLDRYEAVLRTVGSVCRSTNAQAPCLDVAESFSPDSFPPGVRSVVVLPGDALKAASLEGQAWETVSLAPRPVDWFQGSTYPAVEDALRRAARGALLTRGMGVRALGGPCPTDSAGLACLVLTWPVFATSPQNGNTSAQTDVDSWIAALVAGPDLGSDSGSNDPPVRFELREYLPGRDGTVLYDSGWETTAEAAMDGFARVERSEQFRVGDQVWVVTASMISPAAVLSVRAYPVQVLLGGLATTFALVAVVLVANRRARGLAREPIPQSALRELAGPSGAGSASDGTGPGRYEAAARAAHDGLWDWDLEKNELEYSPRWKSLLGFGDHELDTRPATWLERLHPEDRERFQTKLQEHIDGHGALFESENRVRHRDGSYRWMLTRGVAVRGEDGVARRITGSQTDLTDRRQAEKRLLHAGLHDSLTGLPNRSFFMERLARATHRRTKEAGYEFALMFLDVDRFKVVNDSLGHIAGDELLVSIGRRLTTCLRPGDTIARLGGDEFAILLDALREDAEATVIADRIQKELAKPFDAGGQEVYIAVSIGITFSSAASGRPEDLLRNADTAMYRAKAHGKARYELFDQEMSTHGVERLQLERDLRRGLERSEFVLHYQPIVSLRDGQVCGCEALLRWRHPERGLVSPGDFIPIAEETGLILPLSEWVIGTACRQAKAWDREGLPRLQVAVNISPVQFCQQDVAGVVLGALLRSGLPPERLQVELTESALMDHADSTVKPLYELYSKGVHISLDDFGTGYSSLVHLRRFPIGTLKISESFIRQILTNPGDAAIASGLIALAHSLDLTVIVEGVEEAEQLSFLQGKGCDALQGHLVSRPIDAEAFARFVREWRGLSVAAGA